MDKPKRPMSAYMLWLNSVREQIKAEHPGIKVTEIAKLGGEMWNTMKDKSEWEELAAKAKEQYIKDKEKYDKVLALYNGGSGEGSVRRAQKRGKLVRKAAPAKKKRDESEDEDDYESETDSESD